MWNPSTCVCECNKACKIDEYLDIKNCSCEKNLIGKLLLECEEEILNSTRTLRNDKQHVQKDIIDTFSSAIICFLLLVVICVSCYFYYAKYR